MAGVSASGFQFPDYHSNYPPFFTRQKQTEALSTQIEWWCKLILDYCRAHRIFWLDLAKTGDSKLFRNHHSNPVFDRRLSDTDIRFFLQKLVDRNEGEWNEDKTMCLVYWRRPAEWGELIFQWAGRNGFGNGIVTAKTIIDGPYSQGEGKLSSTALDAPGEFGATRQSTVGWCPSYHHFAIDS